MKRPAHGLCLPCTLVRVRDGDTVETRLRTGQTAAIRLLECWAPELREPEGPAARDYLIELIRRHGPALTLWVSLPDPGQDGIVDLNDVLRVITFDRILGRLWAGETDLSEAMVAAGRAAQNKPRPKTPRRRGGSLQTPPIAG